MQNQQKRHQYRNKKILDAARGERCLVNLPGCTGGGTDSVMAHSNQYDDGKGTGQKADDCHVAIACSHCHDILDGRIPLTGIDNIGQNDLIWYHDRGIKRTIRRLLDMGILK